MHGSTLNKSAVNYGKTAVTNVDALQKCCWWADTYGSAPSKSVIYETAAKNCQ